MPDRDNISRQMREEYESRWRAGDPWAQDEVGAAATLAKNQRQRELLHDRRYARTLEIACGNGNLTPQLASISDRVLAIDISAAALDRARTAVAACDNVDFHEANIVEFDVAAEGPWDLVTMIEMIYSLGWLYPFFDIAWLAEQIAESLTPGGRFLLTNTYGAEKDYLLRPYLIDTYRDLFRNVGLQIETEEVFRSSEEISVLMTCFIKASKL